MNYMAIRISRKAFSSKVLGYSSYNKGLEERFEGRVVGGREEETRFL